MEMLGQRYQKMKAKVQSYFRALAIMNLLDTGEVEKPIPTKKWVCQRVRVGIGDLKAGTAGGSLNA